MADELASINGIKPKQVITEGEEVEAKSQSSKAVYKIKQTFDHYYCTCPAWRNQPRVPTNARTCKHLRSILGDKYEDARLKLKNPDGPSDSKAKGKANDSKPASKAKMPSTGSRGAGRKRKARDEDEPEEDVEDEADVPARRTRSARSVNGTGPKSNVRTSTRKPTSTTKGKAKPAAVDDEELEDIEEAEDEDEKPPPSKRAKTTRGGGATSRPVAKNADKGEAKGKGRGKPASEVEAKNEDEQNQGDEVENVSENETDVDAEAEDAGVDGGDELAEINGAKPKVYMKDGEETDVKSMTSSSTYKVKRTWDHYYCTCPAWRNQGGSPVNARTCKHLRSLLGDAYEDARIKLKNPHGPASGSKPSRNNKGSTASKKVPELLLANRWDMGDGPDPTGWWISEKLDGVRTFWDGKGMFSRLGNPFTPPKEMIAKLPKDVKLDGELFGGRGEFQSTVSIVKTMNSPHWQNITFQIFDVPSMKNDTFEDRLAYLQENFGKGGKYASKEFVVVEQVLAESRDHVFDMLKEVQDKGGEGLMLRKPGSLYEGRRSSTLLKIKTFFDAEAVVTGYIDGKGKHKGSTGALKCKMASGKTFSVGSGLSDKQRKNPPKVGSIIVYKFQELTKDRVPRFPTFIGVAADKNEPKDADVPSVRIT